MKEFLGVLWMATIHGTSIALSGIGLMLQSVAKIFEYYFNKITADHVAKYHPKAAATEEEPKWVN